jgi:hypothetical protein
LARLPRRGFRFNSHPITPKEDERWLFSQTFASRAAVVALPAWIGARWQRAPVSASAARGSAASRSIFQLSPP